MSDGMLLDLDTLAVVYLVSSASGAGESITQGSQQHYVVYHVCGRWGNQPFRSSFFPATVSLV